MRPGRVPGSAPLACTGRAPWNLPAGRPKGQFSKGCEAGFTSWLQLQETITFGQTVVSYTLRWHEFAAPRRWRWKVEERARRACLLRPARCHA